MMIKHPMPYFKSNQYFIQYNFYLLLILLCLVNCSKERGASVHNSWQIEAIDTLQVDELNDLKVFDYNSEEGVFLLGDVEDASSVLLPPGISPQGNKVGFIILSRQGDILGRFNNTGEGPKHHGIGSYSNMLLGKNRVGVFSQRGFYIYDYQGNLIKKIAELNSRAYFYQPQYKIGVASGNKIALGYAKVTKGIFEHGDSIYYYLNSFVKLDIDKLISNEKFSIEKVYGNPKTKADPSISEFTPRITVNRGRGIINVFHAKSHLLRQYAIDDGTLVNEISIHPQKFSTDTSYPIDDRSEDFSEWLKKGGVLINSAYHSMSQIGDYTLIRYSSALATSVVNTLVESGGPEASSYWQNVRENHYKHYYLLIKNDRVIAQDFLIEELSPKEGEINFPSFTALRGTIIGGDDLDSLYVFYNDNLVNESETKLIVKYNLTQK